MKTISEKAARKKLGLRIRQLRQDQDLTQKQLGFEAGLSRLQILKLEAGEKNATLETLRSIAGALDVHLKELFEFDY